MARIDFDSPCTNLYLNMLQSVISRMSVNSTGCKSWCIALASAVVVVAFAGAKPDYLTISLVPVVLFLFLDAYYLALERHFRSKQDDFVRKLQERKATLDDLFALSGKMHAPLRSTIVAMMSFSVWPFYLLMIVMFVIVWALLKRAG